MSKITSSSADYQTFPTLFELEPVAGKKVTVEIWNTVYLQKAIEYKKENYDFLKPYWYKMSKCACYPEN